MFTALPSLLAEPADHTLLPWPGRHVVSISQEMYLVLWFLKVVCAWAVDRPAHTIVAFYKVNTECEVKQWPTLQSQVLTGASLCLL